MRNEPVQSNNRSKLSNGNLFAGLLDGRTASGRRYRDLYAKLVDDLGGAKSPGPAQEALIKAAASLMVEAEKMVGEFLTTTEGPDRTEYLRVVKTLLRTLDALGVTIKVPSAQAQDDPDLEVYLTAKARERKLAKLRTRTTTLGGNCSPLPASTRPTIQRFPSPRL